MSKYGRDVLSRALDVTDYEQVAALAQTVKNWKGRIDVLINNAGGGLGLTPTNLFQRDPQHIQQLVNTNLVGTLFSCKAFGSIMVDQGHGKIINVASGFGLRGGRDIYMYCCSKGGMIQLTRTLSFNLARHGVTANSIVPGYVPTGNSGATSESLPRSGDFLPIGKLGKPEDFGPLAVFLASSASDYMTGEMIIADGGGLAGGVTPTGHAPLIPMEL